MINANAMKSLFKPNKQSNDFSFQEFLSITGITEKQFLKIAVEGECSKSTDESCINTECDFNFLEMHQDELYIEVAKEIEDERKAIEDRNKRDMEKYYGG